MIRKSQNAKKNIIFDHLQSLYGDVTFNSQTTCLKGYVIFLYYKNKFSFTTTANIVSETFSCQTTKNQVRHLINNSVIKFKKNILRDMSKFEKMCDCVPEKTMSSVKESVMEWAINFATKKREINRLKMSEVDKEMTHRAEQKRQKKDTKERKKIEKKFKILDISVETFGNEFPDISEANFNDILDVMSGTAIGRNICHIWYEDKK